jgi:hypothetical protein
MFCTSSSLTGELPDHICIGSDDFRAQFTNSSEKHIIGSQNCAAVANVIVDNDD